MLGCKLVGSPASKEKLSPFDEIPIVDHTQFRRIVGAPSNMSRLHGLIFASRSIRFFNLCMLLQMFISRLLNAFYNFSRELLLMVSALAEAHCVFKPFVMQIGLALHLIDVPLMVSVHFWAKIQFLVCQKAIYSSSIIY